LKNQIDEEALEFIKKIDEYEVECKTNLFSIKSEIENNEKLIELKEDLNRWREQMNNFNGDDESWKKIYKEADSKFNQMKEDYQKLYDSLFLDRLNEIRAFKASIGSDRDLIR
jgi:small-conductance mechanosensitive channel